MPELELRREAGCYAGAVWLMADVIGIPLPLVVQTSVFRATYLDARFFYLGVFYLALFAAPLNIS